MLDTSLTHHMNIAHKIYVMKKCGIALINCFNDAFYIPQSYSGPCDFIFRMKSHDAKNYCGISIIIVIIKY